MGAPHALSSSFGIEAAPAEADAAPFGKPVCAADGVLARALPLQRGLSTPLLGTFTAVMEANDAAAGASLDALPDDAALEVLLRLPALARIMLACCSTKWRRLVATPQLWRQRIWLDGMRVAHPDHLRRLLAPSLPLGGPLQLDFRGVAVPQRLHQKRHLCNGDEAVAALASPGPPGPLRTLHCGDAAALTPRAATALAAACPSLAGGSEITLRYGLLWHHDPARLRVPAGCDVRLAVADAHARGDVAAEAPWPPQLNPPPLEPLQDGGQQPERVTLQLAVAAVARSGARLIAIDTYLKERPAAAPLVSFAHMQQNGSVALATLRTLDLRGSNGGPAGGSELAALLGSGACGALQVLNLSSVAYVSEQLARAAAAVPTLMWLDLSRNVLSQAGGAAVAEGLLAAAQAGRAHPLRLDLNNCSLRDAGVTRLAAALERSVALHSLMLHGNVITDAGAAALATAFQHGFGAAAGSGAAFSNPMQALSLADNAIRAGGAAAMAAAFEDGALSHLIVLNMQNTLVGAEGAAALAGALRLPAARCALRCLDLAFCKVGDEGMVALAAALRRNVTLRELNILSSNAGDAGVAALAAALDAEREDGSAMEEEDCCDELDDGDDDDGLGTVNTTLQVLHVGRVQASEACLHALRLATHRMHRCWL